MDFVLIINGIEKVDISETLIYQFFNNATVSVLIGSFFSIFFSILIFAIGIFFAIRQYIKQKEIDRLHVKQDEVRKMLISLDSKIRVIFIECKKVINISNNPNKNLTKTDKKQFTNKVDNLNFEATIIFADIWSFIYFDFADEEKISCLLDYLDKSMIDWADCEGSDDLLEFEKILGNNYREIRGIIRKLIHEIEIIEKPKNKK